MTSPAPRNTILRRRGEGQPVPVTNMELFFDLVYVFTIIELSNHLYSDPHWTGALETVVMFLAVWWGWNYTAWATGWVNPNDGVVVALLAVLMLLGVVMASVIPHAFTTHGQTFAEAYVAMQLIRGGFMVWALRDQPQMRRNYLQLLAWSVISGVFWILGAFVHGEAARLTIWGFAAGLDLTAPLHGFYLPGIGPTPLGGWTLAGEHLAERCQLVLMIAFGETILRLGEAYAETKATSWVDVSLVLGFITIGSLWSLYFLHHALAGTERVVRAGAAEIGALGRSVYSYAHLIMVGAVIVMADAIHLALEHPTYSTDLRFALLTLGGPCLYLTGLTLSKRWLGHGRLLPNVIAMIVMVVCAALCLFLDRVLLLGATALIAALLALWTQIHEDGGMTLGL